MVGVLSESYLISASMVNQNSIIFFAPDSLLTLCYFRTVTHACTKTLNKTTMINYTEVLYANKNVLLLIKGGLYENGNLP